uniref:Protein ABHD13 n=1 Tax=Macrostomum lignano TaxID=282301 RepID=A0A1I8IS92_9PLAT
MRLSSACRPACCCCGLGRRARHRLAGGADFVRRHLAFALAPAACLLAVESGGLVAFAVLLLGALLGLLSLEAYLVLRRPPVPLWAAVPDGFSGQRAGARLHCYFIKQPGDSTRLPTLLFLHGNAGNIGHRLPNAALLFHQCRVNLFLLEYRGYGISTGAPSETGLYADAAAALQHLSRRSDIDPQRVLLFGRSLGGAVAIELAARPETAALLSGLVLENTFTSLPEAASVLFRLPLLSSLPGLVMTNRFNSRAKMPSVRVPTLFISGLRDTLIPPAMSACLHSLCGSGVRRLETFESGEHNTTWQCAGYFQRLAGFLHFASEMAPQREDWHAGQHSEDEEDQSAGAAAAAASATSAAGGASAGTAADDIPTITVL